MSDAKNGGTTEVTRLPWGGTIHLKMTEDVIATYPVAPGYGVSFKGNLPAAAYVYLVQLYADADGVTRAEALWPESGASVLVQPGDAVEVPPGDWAHATQEGTVAVVSSPVALDAQQLAEALAGREPPPTATIKRGG